MSEQVKENIVFLEFLELVRERQAADNELNAISVEEIVKGLLDSSIREWSDTLIINRIPLEDDMEDRIFSMLICRSDIKILSVHNTFEDASSLPRLLAAALPFLEMISFSGFPMTATESNGIFEVLSNNNVPRFRALLLPDYCEGVINNLVHYLQRAPTLLSFVLISTDEGISKNAFQSICSAISDSLSLEIVLLFNLYIKDADVGSVHEGLANAVINSSSIKSIQLKDENRGMVSLDGLHQSLAGSNSVRNSDLCFSSRKRGDTDILIFQRQCWWKSCMAHDIPLNLWPHLLKKADMWKWEASHSHLDILNYFVREKNGELFHNVRRQSGNRKRKRQA